MAKYDFGNLIDEDSKEKIDENKAIALFNDVMEAFKSNTHVIDLMKNIKGFENEVELHDEKTFFKAQGRLEKGLSNLLALLDKSANKPEGFEKVQAARKDGKYKTIIECFGEATRAEREARRKAKAEELKKNGKAVEKVHRPAEKTVKSINEFEEKLLPDSIKKLENCKSVLRGSSNAFEDILETMKNMQDTFAPDKINVFDYEKVMASRKCAMALVAKMNKYLDERKDIGGKLPKNTDDYTGKRYWTMHKIRSSMNKYIKAMDAKIVAECYEYMIGDQLKTDYEHSAEYKFKEQTKKKDKYTEGQKNLLMSEVKKYKNVDDVNEGQVEDDWGEASDAKKIEASNNKKLEKIANSYSRKKMDDVNLINEKADFTIDKLVKKALWKTNFNLDAYMACKDISKNEYNELKNRMNGRKLTFDKADKLIKEFRENAIKHQGEAKDQLMVPQA